MLLLWAQYFVYWRVPSEAEVKKSSAADLRGARMGLVKTEYSLILIDRFLLFVDKFMIHFD